MIKDTDGNLITHAELMDKRVDELKIDVKDSKVLAERMDKLSTTLEAKDEYKKTYAKYKALLDDINTYIPEDKKKLVMDIDDAGLELILLYEEFFYKNGHYDRPEFKGLLGNFKTWLLGCK